VQEPGGLGNASGGKRHFVPALTRAAVAVGVDALFLEVHPDPDRGLSDGPNMWPLDQLEELANSVQSASLCGLGQTAPNPVLTTLRYFRPEYEAHIKKKSCPALVCKELLVYYIEPEICVGCLLCKKGCPVEAISGERKKVHAIDQDVCIKCGACLEICPPKIKAVFKYTGKKKEKILKKKLSEKV
jgi:ferredoxin